MNKVVVQIPCLNEEAAIGKVIRELKKKIAISSDYCL